MPPSQRSTRGKDSLEVRRSRGEISCAECRRHKLKCDKAIPCSSCVRKGCQSLCPNGTLTASHGARSAVADMDSIHHKVSEMGKRIRQLEDALQISHSSVSTAQHPLLAEDLLEIKSGSVPPVPPENQNDVVDGELLDSFGTLAVSDKGTESYIAGTDALLARHLGGCLEPCLAESTLTLPAPVSYLSKTFPFTPLYLPVQEIQVYIEEQLPSYARASALVEAYLENLSWFFRPVDREQIMEELIPDVYRRRRQTSNASSPRSSESSGSGGVLPTDPHVLALLLAVFASGAAADLTLAPWNDEADLYYHLARTAVSLKPVFDGASLHAVQAIALIGAYDLFSCRKNELEGTWKMISFSMSLAASIGLNRDPASFKLSPKLVQRRRRVFWELYTVDIWKSIGSGRPMTFTPSVVDCEFPEDTDADISEDGNEKPSSVWRIRYRFVKEVLTEVVDKLGSVHAVKYSEILALDQKIREFGPQQLIDLTARTYRSQPYISAVRNVIWHVQLGLLKDITLLLLHRSFFARALVEDPLNPMRTQFAPSFLSTYRSAASMLRVVREQFECSAHFLMRLWPIWGHALSASVTLGSIAACGSASALAPQAYVEFNLAVEMFAKVQMHPLVKCGLPILLRLREQAQQALLRHGNTSQHASVPMMLPRSESEGEKEFNGVSSLGRIVRRSFEGEFGSTPQRITDFMKRPSLSGTQMISPSSASAEFSLPFTIGPYPKRDRVSASFGTMPEQKAVGNETSSGHDVESGYSFQQASDRSTGSLRPAFRAVPSVGMCVDCLQDSARSASHSPSHALQELPRTIQLEERDVNASDGPSLMQVDRNSYPAMELSSGTAHGRNADGQVFNPPPHFAYPSSPPGPDMLDTFTTFSDMTVDGGTPGLSSDSIAGYPQMQTQTQPASGTQLSFGTPSTFDSLSGLSPGTVFNSDFDVSFDMRASMGEESVLPLLPQDMEAWRTILQDSRFFGIVDTAQDRDGNPPAL